MKKLDFSLFTDLESKAAADNNDPVVISSEYKLLATKKNYVVNSPSSAAALQDLIREDEGIADAKIVYLEDLIEDQNLYDQLGELIKNWHEENPGSRPHLGHFVRFPGKLRPGGTTEAYWYSYGRYRMYYIQIQNLSHELVHTYNRKHPFVADHNYYIKSWNNPHPFLITGTVEETYTRPIEDKEIAFNSIKLKKTPNANQEDVKFLHINGELNWLEFEDNYYYIGKTLYYKGEQCKIQTLDKNYNIVGENLLNKDLNFNLQDNKEDISTLTPENLTPHKIGETIYVNNVQALITGIIESDLIFHTFTGLSGKENFTSLIFTSEVIDNSEFKEGTKALYNNEKYIVRSKSTTGILLESEEDGSLIFVKNSDLQEVQSQDYKEGDTVYFNGEPYTISSLFNGVAVLTAEGKEPLSINIASNESLSKTPNSTGLSIGETVYINGVQETVKTISGEGFTTEEGTVVEDISEAPSFSTAENSTGLSIGETIYINGESETVKTISGAGLTTEEGSIIQDFNLDPSSSKEPNTTGASIGDYIYINGLPEKVKTISGTGLTTEEGTIVEDVSQDPRFSTNENTTGFQVGDIVYLNGEEMVVVSISGDDLVLEQSFALDIELSAGDVEITLPPSIEAGDELIIDPGTYSEETIQIEEVIT